MYEFNESVLLHQHQLHFSGILLPHKRWCLSFITLGREDLALRKSPTPSPFTNTFPIKLPKTDNSTPTEDISKPQKYSLFPSRKATRWPRFYLRLASIYPDAVAFQVHVQYVFTLRRDDRFCTAETYQTPKQSPYRVQKTTLLGRRYLF